MTPQKIVKRVVVDWLDWVRRMVAEICALPLVEAEITATVQAAAAFAALGERVGSGN